jgi:predicted peroxiredoxin
MAKMLFSGTYASDDPTRAVLPFLSAKAALEAGHETEVFLLGEAVYLMKDEVADACIPVGWPKVGDVMRDVISAGGSLYI